MIGLDARDLISIGVAGVTAALLGALMIRLGPTLGWVDEPDDEALKAHRIAAVPLGGIGVWLGVNLATFVAGITEPALLVGSSMLLGVGLVDDRRPVPPTARLGVEAAAGLVLGFARGKGWGDALLVAALVVVAVNAVNLLDGLDGLAGLSGLAVAIGIGALAVVRGADPTFALLVAAALVGFLVWNWHPARLFLGDNGAYVLALFLVYGFGDVSVDRGGIVVAAALLGVFLIDMAATLLRRMLGRQPLFSRDRLHLYDRLADRGTPIPTIALASGALELAFVTAVLIADRILPQPLALVALLLLGGGIALLLVKGLGATRPGYWANQ
ncbi:MAG: glycosyltransferase family 4 protein [Acidimicrobiia bacterium]|nr:undecaprenyl/decaprenyl-phosphate alpha-N-acetylglucosaminyl 1-phosphate transferase [Actinomycetota bacterium]